jgi:SAM-dependent methyltransferase
MRESVRAFCELAVEHIRPEGPVYEFGSYQVEGQRQRANLRDLFPGRAYVGCDMRRGPGVDRVENLAGLKLPDGSAGTVVCFDTLEHTFDVRQACREMFRVLRPSGVFVVSVPFHFRIHAYPDDYWRITPSALLRLLEPYGAVLLGYQGSPKTPHTVMALAVKRPVEVSFLPQAQCMVEAFQRWLADAGATGPLDRVRRWGQMLLRSKGERARMRAWHEAEFVIHRAADAARAAQPAPRLSQVDSLVKGA